MRKPDRTFLLLREKALPLRISEKFSRRPMKMMMIRNIDLPEAVILYGVNIVVPTLFDNKKEERVTRQVGDTSWDSVNDMQVVQARRGLESFLEECHSVKAAVVVILESNRESNDVAATSMQQSKNQKSLLETVFRKDIANPCHVFVQTVAPPNPSDLISIVNSMYIQPRPYGGSATIGYSRAADPERLLDPKHCVVFTTTIDQTRVARALGMRVVSINPDDDLADAVLMDYDDENISINVGVDDIATPGSFWLNPPHPRDDVGNRVDDPFKTLLQTTAALSVNQNNGSLESDDRDDDDDSYFQAMLNDIAPL